MERSLHHINAQPATTSCGGAPTTNRNFTIPLNPAFVDCRRGSSSFTGFHATGRLAWNVFRAGHASVAPEKERNGRSQWSERIPYLHQEPANGKAKQLNDELLCAEPGS